MQFHELAADIIDHILTSVPDFSTLSASVRISKQVYNVFQARPNSIVLAVAYNVCGPTLPDALQAVRYKSNEEEPRLLIPEQALLKTPVTRSEANMLTDYADVAMRLEDLFSLRHKDRKSACSALSHVESKRFRRAVYRFYIYHSMVQNWDEYVFDHQDINLDELVNALQALSPEQLYELGRLDIFLNETVCWAQRAQHVLSPPLLNQTYNILQLSPKETLNVFEDGFIEDAPNSPDHFWTALERAACLSSVDAPTLKAKSETAITDMVIGEKDACHRCEAVHGLNLWGSSNWILLSGVLSWSDLLRTLDGNLSRNNHETGIIDSLFPENGDLSQMMVEMIDLDDDPTWTKHGWYCMSCVRELCKARFRTWCIAKKQRVGLPFREDCWYGYNCRTQVHRYSHAQRLNHLCAPSRGGGPERPQDALVPAPIAVHMPVQPVAGPPVQNINP